MNVRFKGRGEEESAVGYTKNVSADGMFIGTMRPLPPGTEIVVTMQEGGKTRRQLAVVCHAARVSPLLSSLRTSGMGVRYLDEREARGRNEAVRQAEPEPAEEPVAEGQVPAEEAAGPRRLEIDLSSVERYREAFRRDIQHGLVFALDPGGLEIDQEVLVTVSTPGSPSEVTLKARVDRQTICRSEAYGERGLQGYMLLFEEAERAISRLRAFL